MRRKTGFSSTVQDAGWGECQVRSFSQCPNSQSSSSQQCWIGKKCLVCSTAYYQIVKREKSELPARIFTMFFIIMFTLHWWKSLKSPEQPQSIAQVVRSLWGVEMPTHLAAVHYAQNGLHRPASSTDEKKELLPLSHSQVPPVVWLFLFFLLFCCLVRQKQLQCT